MAFDDKTRNRLNSFVGQARELLTTEFTQQCQVDYGLNPKTGEIKDLEKLRLDDTRRATAVILRETLAHYYANLPTKNKKPEADYKSLIERVIREQAFTILNRLCAIRMAEARELVIESVAKGLQSKGFQLYQHVAGTSLGDTGAAYELYLFSLFDEFTVDLAVLFDRFSPQGRLFPRETVLMQLIGMINDAEINHLWAEDETIGWIYQYFNSKEENKAAKLTSDGKPKAPENSRELAVRNQFFTPRYVVKFLTDNTLGRIWYEMRQGNVRWIDDCKYLVRRPDEVFLAASTSKESKFVEEGVVEGARQLMEGTEEDFPEFSAEDDEQIQRMIELAHCVSAYTTVGYQAHDIVHASYSSSPSREQEGRALGPGDGFFDSATESAIAMKAGDFAHATTQQILNALFMTCRNDRHGGDGSVYRERWFADACNEVRRRVLNSRRGDFSQGELLKAPVIVPYRPLKDPREICMLDPACGSMHFGLYAFDLYLNIYGEYWDICSEPGFREPKSEHRLPTEEYADKTAWMKAAPKLVIEHNIHGIDIDPRAVQIAGLSLWLRAQRAWKTQGIAAQDRLQVERSNIVCAEPMPGDKRQLEEFCKDLNPAIAQMVTAIFEEMKLAGEAGSLLKIEEEVKSLVAKAHEQWRKEPKAKQLDLFGGADIVKEKQLEFDLSGITDELFFEKAEEEIYESLFKYAEENAIDGYRRKLFANDTERGFAFIEICRKMFDCILMNPPFGEPSTDSKSIIERNFPLWCKNVICAFQERALKLARDGFVGCVYDKTVAIKKSYEKFRKAILTQEGRIQTQVDLGWEVLDANVEVAAVVLTGKYCGSRDLFYDVSTQEEKDVTLQRAIRTQSLSNNCFLAKPQEFRRLPNFILAFQFPHFLRRLFLKEDAISEHNFEAFEGHTLKADRHFRLVWELPESEDVEFNGSEWTWLYHGQAKSLFYAHCRDVARYGRDGESVRYDESVILRNISKQGKRGVSWSKRGQFLDAQVLEDARVCSVEGKVANVPNAQDRLYFAGLLSCNLFQYGINYYCGQHKTSGYVSIFPFTNPSVLDREIVIQSVQQTRQLKVTWQRGDETDILFHKPYVLLRPSESLMNALDEVIGFENELDTKARILGSTLEETFLRIYEITDEDSENISYSVKSRPEPRVWEDGPRQAARKRSTHVSLLVSYAVGCVFKRWKLPVLLQNDFDSAPTRFPPAHWGAKSSMIFVAERGHSLDIVEATLEFLDKQWPNAQQSPRAEIEVFLTECSSSYRAWFESEFFSFHLSHYTKSRRTAPIYWPISTDSGSYTLWLYYHDLTDQTLFKVVNDFVDPKIRETDRQVTDLRAIKDRASSQERELGKLMEFKSELDQFKADLLGVAAFWKPNLNDGVQITAAPLWKFFRHTGWRNKLKKTWEELQEGKYDWAHLALSIWPDRVVKGKCTTDRSMAIAHDLVEQLWHEVEVAKELESGRVTTKIEWQRLKLTDEELVAIAEMKTT